MTEGKAEEPPADESAVEVTPAEPVPAEAAPAETVPAEAKAPSTEGATSSESGVPTESGLPTEAPTRPGNLGIWAFVLSLLGIVGLLPIIGSVLGYVLGRVALRQADSRRLRGGRGLAIAAVTISVITLAVIVLSVAAYALVVAYLEI